ncbi:polysaccharide ABC transporter ATP-binding protein [Francisella adeliensis]|uniref:ABC transporter ATP-binding protein n=1 Tax=Francisella adeliensis TaxID=2007306 RepID=A0A2Z4XY91_9GAMM|nr:ABC transporter ATP-binding protein [Francisella adeliensis]AXA33403.1 ABC transporter ATP-binding protein [Francisella adeliensis]MBK2085419.1 ATP-binding cassette domain-containing protein [Francisella adeliensis]MBK2097149.1 ATP-binding cassette domain-containing protein [Francisella adeliensis]QIW11631.1 ATP-binding cassette domain-containing protein [Francisella adeliensis]QIW13506.1 ATP-binding cassette domain-containing protein [Francisella adeliensis]
MKKNVAIELKGVSKYYKTYDRARDRVKEAFSPIRKKYYKNFCAIKDVDLTIEKGEVLGLFGLNGAGKSTLLKMIAGVVTPTSGRVNVHGNINAMLELSGSLNPEMTGRQNIKLNLSINGIENKHRDIISKGIIEFAELGGHIDQPVKTYSSGMQARLGFGIATSTKPEILIVDEVLAVGDAIFQSKCFTKIRELLRGGTTVVFVSHSVELMIEFCNRAVLLHDRKVVMDGDVRQIGNIYQKIVFSDDQSKALADIQNKINNLGENQGLNVFDDNFDNTQFYENDYIIIKKMAIMDKTGSDICILTTGGSYSFEIDIEFKRSFEEVKFNFIVVDITNKTLNTLSKYKDNDIIMGIKENDCFQVRNSFLNDQRDGQFTIKMSVDAITNDGDSLDISIVEAKTMFKSSMPNTDNKLLISKV